MIKIVTLFLCIGIIHSSNSLRNENDAFRNENEVDEIVLDLQDLVQKEIADSNGGTWHSLNLPAAFNAGFYASDYNNGACYSGWKDAKFMKYPYINTAKNALVAHSTQEAVNRNACVYQHTGQSCTFSIGGEGLQQIEFDYSIQGDTSNQWFSFWVNSKRGGRWVKDAEIDQLEFMHNRLAHNFAGYGHQTAYRNTRSGHTTLKVTQTEARSIDCAEGSTTCPEGGDWANHYFNSGTVRDIRNGSLKHHLTIDFWYTKGDALLVIYNLRLKGGNQFTRNCGVAQAI